jgi:hypothetical protein
MAADDAALSAALVERLRTEAPPERPAAKPAVMWKMSIAVLAAAAAADALSSWNKRELNPVLAGSNGRFGARGLAVKSLITGGAIGGQLFLVRRNPEASKAAAIANFGMSGMFAAAAAHNMGNKAAPATLGK